MWSGVNSKRSDAGHWIGIWEAERYISVYGKSDCITKTCISPGHSDYID